MRTTFLNRRLLSSGQLLLCSLLVLTYSSAHAQERSRSNPPGLLPTQMDSEPETMLTQGELRQVRSPEDGTTRYAIIDDGDQIVAFLAPTARYDLRRYLGKTVDVTATIMDSNSSGPPHAMIDTLQLTGGTEASSKSSSQPVGSGLSLNAPSRNRQIRQVDFEEVPTPADSNWEVMPPGEPKVMHDGSMHGGGPIYDEPTYFGNGANFGGYVDGGYGCSDSCGHDSCTDCTSGSCCGGSCGSCGGCGLATCGTCASTSCLTSCGEGCGPPGWIWVRGEYLNWWSNGFHIPALISQSSAGTAPIIGLGDTRVLLGNEDILDDSFSGYRIRFGGFLGPCKKFAWEGEYLQIGEENFFYEVRGDANGNPSIGRPFFNLNPPDNIATFPIEDAELVAFRGELTGSITVEATSQLQGASGRIRKNFCCNQCCLPCDPCNPCGIACSRMPRPYSRTDFFAGYRYLELDESLTIREDLRTLSDPPGTFEIFDRFQTQNSFHGGEVGAIWQGGFNRWTLENQYRIALGNIRQKAILSGQTIFSPLSAPQEIDAAGLLVLPTNSGTYSRDVFGVVSELGTTLGYYLTPRLRATVGYTFLYMSRVVRPGDVIDREINEEFIPSRDEDSPVGPRRPEFVFRDSDYWAQGINVGLDLSW